MNTKRSLVGFVIWLAVCFGAAAFGGRFSPGEWYSNLSKPSWTPPGYVFPPVWTFLYITMGTAAWLVWKKEGFSGRAVAPLTLFLVQLLLNAVWPWLFFGLHLPGLAFAELVLLWLVISVVLVTFFKQDTWAGALLVPYLLLVSFAAALNFSVWRLNL